MKKQLIGLTIAAAAALPAYAQQQSVEVLHWWTSGGEAAALNVLKKNLEAEGVTWKDMPVAGGGGEQAMTALRARVTAGNPPTAVQALGFDITDWAKQGVVGDLTEVATKEGWDKVVPAPLQKFSKYDGNWVAAPVNIHRTNWIWANKAIFDKLGIQQPTTWDELIAALDKIKAAGYVALAARRPALAGRHHLRQRGAFRRRSRFLPQGADRPRSRTRSGSPTMKTVFERMIKLRGYVDPNFSGRDWNLATAMVINGKAGMQIMGDWAKGEFLNAGKVPGKDFLCFRFPGTQGIGDLQLRPVRDVQGLAAPAEAASSDGWPARSWTRPSSRRSTW